VRDRGANTDFTAPASSTYLRFAYTTTPGDSPERAWEEQESSFKARHAGYQRLRIEPTTFQGFDGAIWEFTWREGSTQMHSVDLGFVTGRYGFALNFVTRESDWIGAQDVFQRFQQSFVAP
jgi:hypothetical protein